MVTMGTPGQNGIPAGCDYDNFQTDVVAYNTARATTATALATLNTRQAEFATAQAGQNTTTTSTFVTTTAYVCGINDALTTGVRRDKDGNEIQTLYNPEGLVPDLGDLASIGRDIVSTVAIH